MSCNPKPVSAAVPGKVIFPEANPETNTPPEKGSYTALSSSSELLDPNTKAFVKPVSAVSSSTRQASRTPVLVSPVYVPKLDVAAPVCPVTTIAGGEPGT